jgi:hypothetical protein
LVISTRRLTGMTPLLEAVLSKISSTPAQAEADGCGAARTHS